MLMQFSCRPPLPQMEVKLSSSDGTKDLIVYDPSQFPGLLSWEKHLLTKKRFHCSNLRIKLYLGNSKALQPATELSAA